MQLHHSFVSLLAALYILEPAFAIAIVRPQAHLSLDPSLAPLKRSLDPRMAGLRFFRRKATAALPDDWNAVSRVGGQKPDAAHTPKQIRSLITLHPVSSEGDQRESHIFIGRHRRRRSFHRSMLPPTHIRRFAAPISDVTSFRTQGVAGTIDIMSPTAGSLVGERIASLSVSTETSDQNQFVLNASGVNASTVYLVVKSDAPMKDGSLTVALQVPVFDQAKASYVAYCATFDTTQASPLVAVECINSDQDVTDHSSQLFSYNSTSGVVKPLWLTSAPLPDMESPATAKEEDVAAQDQELPEESDSTSPSSDSSDGAAPAPQSVSLVFTPDVDSSTPVVNSQSSVEFGDGSNSSDTSSFMTSSTQISPHSVAGMAMNTNTPSYTSRVPTATAEEVGAGTITPTMCPGSAMMQTSTPSVVVGDSIQPPGNVEASPMAEEPTSSTAEEPREEPSSTPSASNTDSALPTEPAARRRHVDMGDDDPEAGSGTTEMGVPNNEAKRAVDTVYVWKFSSARAVGDDDADYVQ